MKKERLIILYDGTWNDPQDQTNVYRFARQVHDHDGEIRQRFFYEPGVGTTPLQKFRGGALGWGLSKNLEQGYEYLAKKYKSGDEIWVFGFSRGAYCARSLVGMINKCGLLHITSPSLMKQVKKLYRKKLNREDAACVQFRERYSREVKIHFLGVWDTVGALGIPGTFLSEKGAYAWHDTRLSPLVERAYQAAALDEHREAYDISLWTSEDGKPALPEQRVEQRWFIGAHANVGGGYGKEAYDGKEDTLAHLPMQWMQQHAIDAGLKLDPFACAPNAWEPKPVDSYRKFMFGLYARYKKLTGKDDGRFTRIFDRNRESQPAINISVDSSVWKKWQAEADYRPETLRQAGQKPPGDLGE